MGKKAVPSRIRTHAAEIQWNTRSGNACRTTRSAVAEPRELAREDVTAGLSLLRCEDQPVHGMAHDQHATEADEQPQEIPRHALQGFAAIDVSADSKQLHFLGLATRMRPLQRLGAAPMHLESLA